MKTFNYRSRAMFISIIACLFVSAYANQAMAYDELSRRGDVERSITVRPIDGSARLIIHRIPNLGNRVIVNVYVDGASFATVGYGHTYDGFLAPGRHVLSVIPTPGPKWSTPWQMILDARSGRTYSFTAMGDHSGSLILKGGLDVGSRD